MPASEQLSRLAPYARQMLDDDYVQDELGRLFTSLRDGSQRARRQGPAQAATDRQLRNQLAAALAAATHVVGALKEPEPEPPKRRRPPSRSTSPASAPTTRPTARSAASSSS
jgi:hypothetical protein